MTNEHDELARRLPDPADRDLSAHRHRQIQEFLMTEMQPEARPVRRPRRRFALVTASVLAAAAVAAGVTTGGFGQLSGGADTAPDTAASQQVPNETPVAATFRLAAATAASEEWTDPRPDQWTYSKQWSEEDGPLAAGRGFAGEGVTNEWWEKVDGTNVAGPQENGNIEQLGQENDIPYLSSLPTDPEQLLAELREYLSVSNNIRTDRAMPLLVYTPETEEEWNFLLYSNISNILAHRVLPPDVTSALWKAAALIPDVVQHEETVEVEGHTAVALGVVYDGWLETQLLVDPDTHEYVGRRTLYAADHTYGPEDGNVEAKKGEVEFVTIRLASGIVDKPGDTV